MKYKNIVFDFGNVIGRFDGKAILSEFCPHEEELDYLSEIVYKRWAELDAGTLDYDSYINEVIDQVPEHLKDCIRRFAKEWPRCTTLLPDTITFIHELKERNIPRPSPGNCTRFVILLPPRSRPAAQCHLAEYPSQPCGRC